MIVDSISKDFLLKDNGMSPRSSTKLVKKLTQIISWLSIRNYVTHIRGVKHPNGFLTKIVNSKNHKLILQQITIIVV